MQNGLKTRNTFVYFILSISLFLLYFNSKKELINFERFEFEDDYWKLFFWMAVFFGISLFIVSMSYLLKSIKVADEENEDLKKKAHRLFRWCFILFISFSVTIGVYMVFKGLKEPEKTSSYRNNSRGSSRGGSRGGYRW